MRSWILVALDIDGTLVDLAGAGARAMDRAFCQHLALPSSPRRGSFAGRTDLGVVKEVFREHAVRTEGARRNEGDSSVFFSTYLEFLKEEVETTPYSATPGAEALVEKLWAEPEIKLGLATGNVRDAALLKLSVAGLRVEYDFGAFGGEHELRDQLLVAAFDQAESALPAGDRVQRKIVVGDTPHDIQAAHAVGAQAVAVAQGPYTIDELRRHGPDFCVADLSPTVGSDFWTKPI